MNTNKTEDVKWEYKKNIQEVREELGKLGRSRSQKNVWVRGQGALNDLKKKTY